MKKLHPTVQALLTDVEDFCTRAKIDPSRFGIMVLNDSHFVFRLRKGRQPRLATIDKVHRFINRKTKAVDRKYDLPAL